MYTVYVLRNKAGKLYKGYTGNIEQRMAYHNSGLTNWTREKGPWDLVYVEEYANKQEALKREKLLKSGQGRDFLKQVIFRDVAQPG